MQALIVYSLKNLSLHPAAGEGSSTLKFFAKPAGIGDNFLRSPP